MIERASVEPRQLDGRPHYTRTAVALHWIMAAALVGNFLLGWTMADLPFSPSRLRLFSYHKWVGITLLAVALARLGWRLFHAPPALPRDVPRWQRGLAHGAHGLLYLLFFAIPLSGWAYSSAAGFPVVYLGVLPLPDFVAPDKALARQLVEVHTTLAWTLAAVVGLHVAGALLHTFKDGVGYLERMLSWRTAG